MGSLNSTSERGAWDLPELLFSYLDSIRQDQKKLIACKIIGHAHNMQKTPNWPVKYDSNGRILELACTWEVRSPLSSSENELPWYACLRLTRLFCTWNIQPSSVHVKLDGIGLLMTCRSQEHGHRYFENLNWFSRTWDDLWSNAHSENLSFFKSSRNEIVLQGAFWSLCNT